MQNNQKFPWVLENGVAHHVNALESASQKLLQQMKLPNLDSYRETIKEMTDRVSVLYPYALKEQEWAKDLMTTGVFAVSDHIRSLELGSVAQLKEQTRIKEQARIVGLAMDDLLDHVPDFLKGIQALPDLSKLQSIGLALDGMPAFDEELVSALRRDLGDWRDRISWTPEIFDDRQIRSEFYEALGFNRDLTNFPDVTFARNLDVAGLRASPPALVALYGAPVPAREIDDNCVHPQTAFDWLFNFETGLRAFIDRTMTQRFGSDWPKLRTPNGFYDRWREKQKKAVEAGKPEMPLVCYADFTEYEQVICRTDNWCEVFIGFFGRPESVRESLQRLYPIRICTMHARPITKDDELLLYVELKRLGKAFDQ